MGLVRFAFTLLNQAGTEMLTLAGKTGTRTVPLAPAAVKLFERLTQGQGPQNPQSPIPSNSNGSLSSGNGTNGVVVKTGIKE